MTRNCVVRYELPSRPCMPRPCHASVWPGAVKLPLRQRQTKIIGRAPAISKVATATTGKPGAFHRFYAVASNAQSRLKIP
jgi:hypothetical protein